MYIVVGREVIEGRVVNGILNYVWILCWKRKLVKDFKVLISIIVLIVCKGGDFGRSVKFDLW